MRKVPWRFAGILAACEGDTLREPVLTPLSDAADEVRFVALQAASHFALTSDTIRIQLRDAATHRAVHAFASSAQHIEALVWHENDPEYLRNAIPYWTKRDEGLALSLVHSDDAQRLVWCRNHSVAVRDTDAIRQFIFTLPSLLANAPPRSRLGTAHVYFKPLQWDASALTSVIHTLVRSLQRNEPMQLACYSWEHAHPGASFSAWPTADISACLLDDDVWNTQLQACDPTWHAPLTPHMRADAAASAAAAGSAIVASETAAHIALDAATEAAMHIQEKAAENQRSGNVLMEKADVQLASSVLDELEDGFERLIQSQSPKNTTSTDAWCNACQTAIKTERYRCVTCPDWDACAACYQEAASLHPGHKFIHLANSEAVPNDPFPDQWVWHPYVTCNGCRRRMRGPRYKCTECIGYDLCTECECSPLQTHRSDAGQDHIFVKLETPLEAKRWQERNQDLGVKPDQRSQDLVQHAELSSHTGNTNEHSQSSAAYAANAAFGAMQGLVKVAQTVLDNPLLQEKAPGVRIASKFVSSLQSTEGAPFVDQDRLYDAILHVVRPYTNVDHFGFDNDVQPDSDDLFDPSTPLASDTISTDYLQQEMFDTFPPASPLGQDYDDP
ncbi:hypothetical protein MYAM1_002430 [Malassezia yamatoensis]|uniref:ZZ-type domain-containing protein n=1 Tax=Malassezia yamatoensis TaxID=253288 RepID=A0AAJ6CHX0_9BASI|nr:hypothetical protein MYAM1_002430 [Malassezia yamatoensis]